MESNKMDRASDEFEEERDDLTDNEKDLKKVPHKRGEGNAEDNDKKKGLSSHLKNTT